MKIKINDTVLLKWQSVYPKGLTVSPNRTYTVVDIYNDGKLQLAGVPEPQDSRQFDKMVIGKVKGYR